MSLRFYFGPSGAGKSTKLYKELIKRSMEEPDRNFLVIVPDQFTMQTQKELVTMHERGGIMNIDVLSFGRLSHRIFEEVGGNDMPVLDDTGKSLVLRKVAADLKDRLPVLGGNLDKQGYIHEVKSAISEFMQYGIAPGDVEKLIAYAEKKGALKAKLKDLEVLYQGFKDYIKDQFITTEETLDLLQRALHQSGIIPESVVVFDGFTGFTPIQNRVIRELMVLASEVIVTVTVDVHTGEQKPWQSRGEQELFYLGRKTANDLCKLAEEAGVPRGRDVYLTGGKEDRFAGNPSLYYLERHLFRYPMQVYSAEQNNITIYEASDIGEEVRQMGILLERLIREKGYLYRDIAVICGDLESYAEHVETAFDVLGIPCYVDRTRGIVLNPFIEFIKSALEILEKDFSYASVFRYLRSGMADFTLREVDVLENYVLQSGIRGRRRWERPFAHKIQGMEEDVDRLELLNGLRQRLLAQLAPLLALKKTETAGAYVRGLYEFLTACGGGEKLADFERKFTREGNLSAAKEYGQIYRLVMELLEQIMGLLGEETMGLDEFADILEAGFGEIQVGTIPQNVDRVLVGDMERTRLKEVKVLFFVGVDDGNIPRSSGKGGIISDIDREFLSGSQLELAPSPRQQMYIQRLYLYLNMTKPTQRLYLSYAKVNGEGKSLRPAYLIDMVRKMYPGLEVLCPETEPMTRQILTPRSGMKYLAAGLRSFAAGYATQPSELFTLYHAYEQSEANKWTQLLTAAAFQRYEKQPLAREVARALYGQILQSSVSRLETYAACAYEHFLKYGLQLQERREFGFEAVDMGNVFHSVLETFAGRLEESGYTWFNFPEEFGARAVSQAMDGVAAQYGDTVLYSSARNAYAVRRMKRILTRTVQTLQYQLRRGMFVPGSYELSFSSVADLDSINIALSDQEKMRLQGRVDRIDTCEDDEKVYVKVVDYKSGNHQFDLVALYHGLQLQLVVYLNAAMELEKRKHPDKEVVPGAMLYYHVADPAVEAAGQLADQELNELLVAKLRTIGIVNADAAVVERLDRELEGKSDVIPVERKKDGSLSTRSSALSREELQDISDYVNQKVRAIGREILDGNISLRPYESGDRQACTFCDYRAVCGFDPGVRGYEKNRISNMSKEEALEAIRKEVEQDGC
ncbi:MAG: helicase-exonuclease AddAB subunit AddB [Lachnospiraceae bacterium]|nr:helicase-exonuclease AddAB subunit AddB [Lachnospiraceae bacterium]